MFSIKITHQNDEPQKLVTSPFEIIGKGSPALKKKKKMSNTSTNDASRRMSSDKPAAATSIYSPKSTRRYSSQTSDDMSDGGAYKPIGTVKPFQTSSRRDSNLSTTDPSEKSLAAEFATKEVDNHQLSHQANMNTKKITELQTLFDETRMRIQKLLRGTTYQPRDAEFDRELASDKVFDDTIVEE